MKNILALTLALLACACVQAKDIPIGDNVLIDPEYEVVILDGNITPATADKVMEALDATGWADLVVYNSRGGDVKSAISIGTYLRAEGVRTTVFYQCNSACVYMLAGSEERLAFPDAEIGVHRPKRYDGEPISDAEYKYDDWYFTQMGMPGFAKVMYDVPNFTMRLLKLSYAMRVGLITKVMK